MVEWRRTDGLRARAGHRQREGSLVGIRMSNWEGSTTSAPRVVVEPQSIGRGHGLTSTTADNLHAEDYTQ
jgi:hypothetical protein